MDELTQGQLISKSPMQIFAKEAEGVCACEDLVCFSHLRWDFVFQRPQHLLTRFANHRRVFYVEEPLFDSSGPGLKISTRENGLRIVTPHLPEAGRASSSKTIRAMLDQMILARKINDFTLWYYTPMALEYSRHLKASHVIYDCMDELSAFKDAPPELMQYENELFKIADQVFTGGHSLFEAKRNCHPNVRPFPSSIDFEHFNKARRPCAEPADQKSISHPRFGFYGVLDERTDFKLIEGLARAKPNWQIILIGPIVKVDPSSVPRMPNIHYLGMKSYQSLPEYLAGWDVALLPFAINRATRFISPTKTPEYLAAGKPVVSTAIHDVVRPYGELKLVSVARDLPQFIAACEKELEKPGRVEWRAQVDAFLAKSSWEQTWQEMARLELEWRYRG